MKPHNVWFAYGLCADAAATIAEKETAPLNRKGQFGENGLSDFQQLVAISTKSCTDVQMLGH